MANVPTNQTFLSNAYPFQFGQIQLNGALLSWKDKFDFRFAKFAYLKRDGAEQEDLGADAAQFTFSCSIFGTDVTQKYNKLISSLKKNRRGLLVHPRLGKIQAALKSINGDETPSQGIDNINFTLTFEEDELDKVLIAEKQLGPGQVAGIVDAKRQQLVTDSQTLFAQPSGFLPSFNTYIPSALQEISNLSDLAAKFIAVAVTVSQSSFIDPEFISLIGRLQLKFPEIVTVIRKTGRSDAELFPIFQQTRSMIASCIDLYQAVLAQKPPIESFVVPKVMSLANIALNLYGSNARSKLPELQQLNVFLKNHFSIPAGTVLLVTSPAVLS